MVPPKRYILISVKSADSLTFMFVYSANPLHPPERVAFASLNHDLCKLGAQLTFISFVVHLVQERGLSLSSHKIWRKCIFGEATFLPALSWLQMQNLSSSRTRVALPIPSTNTHPSNPENKLYLNLHQKDHEVIWQGANTDTRNTHRSKKAYLVDIW